MKKAKDYNSLMKEITMTKKWSRFKRLANYFLNNSEKYNRGQQLLAKELILENIKKFNP